MSETKENCPECDHEYSYHRGENMGTNPGGRICAYSLGCYCTRTYESLVGEKEILEKPDWLHEYIGNNKFRTWRDGRVVEADKSKYSVGDPYPLQLKDAKPEPSLSLQFLVVDLQTHCIVKMEKGGGMCGYNGRRMEEGDVEVFHTPFEALRATWDESTNNDAGKPVPRIERNDNKYRVHIHEAFCKDIDESVYDTLSRLVGKPLPIYSGGSEYWTQLFPHDDRVNATFREIEGVKIWRYCRP